MEQYGSQQHDQELLTGFDDPSTPRIIPPWSALGFHNSALASQDAQQARLRALSQSMSDRAPSTPAADPDVPPFAMTPLDSTRHDVYAESYRCTLPSTVHPSQVGGWNGDQSSYYDEQMSIDDWLETEEQEGEWEGEHDEIASESWLNTSPAQQMEVGQHRHRSAPPHFGGLPSFNSSTIWQSNSMVDLQGPRPSHEDHSSQRSVSSTSSWSQIIPSETPHRPTHGPYTTGPLQVDAPSFDDFLKLVQDELDQFDTPTLPSVPLDEQAMEELSHLVHFQQHASITATPLPTISQFNPRDLTGTVGIDFTLLDRTVKRHKLSLTFVDKVCFLRMMTDDSIREWIHWDSSGESIVIPDQAAFADIVCPRYFHHRRWNSFYRQSSTYKIKVIKRSTRRVVLCHPKIKKDDKQLWTDVQAMIEPMLRAAAIVAGPSSAMLSRAIETELFPEFDEDPLSEQEEPDPIWFSTSHMRGSWTTESD